MNRKEKKREVQVREIDPRKDRWEKLVVGYAAALAKEDI